MPSGSHQRLDWRVVVVTLRFEWSLRTKSERKMTLKLEPTSFKRWLLSTTKSLPSPDATNITTPYILTNFVPHSFKKTKKKQRKWRWLWLWRFDDSHLPLTSLCVLFTMPPPSITWFSSLSFLLLNSIIVSFSNLFSFLFFVLGLVFFAKWSCVREGDQTWRHCKLISNSLLFRFFYFILKIPPFFLIWIVLFFMYSGQSNWMLHLKPLILKLLT